MRFSNFLALALVLSCASLSRAASGPEPVAPPAEGPTEIVKEIHVKGQKSLSEDKVLAVVRQRVDEALNMGVVNEDLKRIWKMGLFSDVVLKAEPVGAPGAGVKLLFEVSERPTIQEVRFFGNKEFGDGNLKDKVALEDNSTYDQARVAAAVKAIEDQYKEKHYYAVQVKVQTKPGKIPGQVVVNFTVDEGNRMRIEEIKISGNKEFSADKVKKAMQETEEYGLIYGSGAYDAAKLEKDLELILRAYASEGYGKAKLEGVSLDEFGDKGREAARKVTEFDEANKRIVIHIHLEEGKRFRMGRPIVFSGLENSELFTPEQFLEKMNSDEDEWFNQDHWDADMALLRSAYAEKGHIYAGITPKFDFDEQKREVRIALTFSEGSKAFVEEIRIRGNDVTKDKVIRRMLTLKEGDAFDSEAIGKDRMRIYNLGFFENVAVDTQPGSEMDKLILIFDVSPERKTGTLSVGAGYSSVEGLVGFLQVSQNNLFGNGQSISAQWDFGDRKRSYSLSFTEPWLMDKPISLGADIYDINRSRDYNSQGFEQESIGGSIRLGYTLSEYWKVFNTYRYQSDKTSDVRPGLIGIPEGIENISSITPSLSRDSRDNIFDATRGSFNILSMTMAGGYLGADKHYFKPVFDSRLFLQTPAIFGMKWMNMFVLGLHGRVGKAWAYDSGSVVNDTVPVSERFFMGGTDTVRGYFDRSLGASQIGGGLFTVLANVEYGFKPAPPLKLRVFYDAGNSWENHSKVDWSHPYLYPSWGLGMLFTIPTSVIQIRLDYGWGLDPSASGYSSNGRLHFNIGNIF